MTSIRSFSEILREGEIDAEARARFAGIIHQESTRLTRLLDDLLDLSYLENGQVQLDLGRGSLADVLDRAVMAAGVPGDRLALRRDSASERVQIETDLERLTQVFINLITNAAKYCDADRPELVIRARADTETCDVDFIDNGTPLDAEAQVLIFEKFSRLADEGKAGGAGLGLAICRQIMESLGGGISYLPGQGGPAFRVTLRHRVRMAAQ
jgi:signal transduction histidine kinase